MKRVTTIFAALALALCSITATAQTAAYKGSLAYFTPETAIKVTVTVEHETIKKGPYAKYSQQYLGITAPLSDKSFFRIVGATMEGFNQTDPSSIAVLGGEIPVGVAKDGYGEGGVESSYKKGRPLTSNAVFPDLGINPIVYKAASSLQSDRTSIREKSVDDMAMDAANTIFTLRKRRFDLITGELGENAFGEGLKAAIKEMRRIEDEYIALFAGKSSVEVKSYEFYVVPQVGKSSYTVCSFSEQSGVGEASSGEAITLSITADGSVRQPALGDKKSSTSGVYYRVADMATCRLVVGGEIIELKRIPIYQNGAMLEAK